MSVRVPSVTAGGPDASRRFSRVPALARDYLAHGGEDIPAIEIAARAARGEARATGCLDRYERRFARAIASVINVVDPDVVVLGGGLSNMPRLYERVPALWSEHVFSDRVATKLRPAKHGDASGVRGAAWLWESLHSNSD